jgi:Meckel syndrome type 1 protein
MHKTLTAKEGLSSSLCDLSPEMFEYKFEHTSSTISSSNKEKEKNIVQELNRQRVGEILTSVGDSFADPPSSSVSVMVLGEVVSARDFEYEDLYITTSLKLPRGWKCTSHSEEELTLLSQISHSKSLHLTNVAHFSLPFEYHLLFSCKHEEESDDANEECCHLLSMPTFHFEVGSIDTWDRHRMEGYAHWSLPPQPGYYSPSVSTWRPMGKSLLEELRRFFVGGGPQLEDITYSGIPADVKGFNVAKYGMRTKTAGSVQLRVHIVHQSRELQESHVNTLPTTSQSALLFSTETILENYRQTKLKMAASLKNQSTDSLEQD